MKVTGSHTLQADRAEVWQALQDPAVLVRTLPGCKRLEADGDGVYTVTVAAGVASIKGVYTGSVALSDQVEPSSYTLRARGQGGPGTIDATARVTLEGASGGGTVVSYEADAVVGGAIAGVGQRVLLGVAKRNAQDFFTAVDRAVRGELVPGEGVAAGVAGDGRPAPDAAPVAAGTVWEAPQPAPGAQPDVKMLVGAALVGALIALLGVLVGRRTAR